MAREENTDGLKVEAVIFDLDETLIDSIQGHSEAHSKVFEILIQFFKEKEISVDLKALRLEISKLDDDMNRRIIYDRDDWWPVLVKKFSDITLPKKLTKKLTREYWSTYASSAKPYPDAIPTLHYLKRKGYRLGLISDTDALPGMKRRRIEIQPFKDLFDLTLVSGEETRESKPSPEPFLVAAEKLGVKPERCVFVGDKPFADIEGAKKAGMVTMLIHRRDWKSSIKANFTIQSLEEIKHIL